MNLIGLLGGMSWQSTAEYYRLFNELTAHRRGGLHSAELLLHSVDFAEIERLQATGDWEGAGERLATVATGLERAGADLLVLCTNTMHKVAPAIEAAVDVPLLHLGDATAEAVRRRGLSRVGLLGTAFTMEQDFYRDRISAHGPEVLVPEATDRAAVHRVIYEELCRGMARDRSRDLLLEVIDRLHRRGCEGVVLGCTELELLIDSADTHLPVFPTTRIHVEAALRWAAPS